MKIRYSLLFGFVLILLGISICKGELCPNAPVTPYPIPATPLGCSNQPIPTNPVQIQSPQMVPCPTSTNPCSPPLTNPNCYQCQPCPSPIIQTTSIQTSNCIYQSGYTCQTNSNIQCCSQTCCQNCLLTSPCSSPTNTNCCSTKDCCCTKSCCKTEPTPVTTQPPQLPQTTQPPTQAETTETPPDPIIKCPPGTVLIGNKCHLLYCPNGFHMLNDRCIVIECPAGTSWTGHRCSVLQPYVHNVTFYNTIVTHFNQTKPDIILNNANNIVVNASLTLFDNNNNNNMNNECDNDYDDCNDTTTAKPKMECCVVMTPRICENRNNRWRCYSRRSRRCGEFCVAPIIYLKPPRVHVRSHTVVMLPIQYDCKFNGNCGPLGDGYDCSGCATNIMERCSQYCYRYSCSSRRCDFYDQEKYCAFNTGSYGCQEEDGCFDTWCH